jgi:cyclopropane-fatty-acyl-phospholipid synthase
MVGMPLRRRSKRSPEAVTTAPHLPVPLGRPELPRTLVGRQLRIAEDCIAYGPAVAAINYFTSSPTLIDPEFVWRFFTKMQPAVIQFFIDHYPVSPIRRRIIKRMIKQVHSRGIEYHYDLSNGFYSLFLDRRFMFYSCADFRLPDDTLEQAQLNKANHLLSLIAPQPGEKILELGCGWGSMLHHIHATTGDKEGLFGYTLSREQKSYVEETFGFKVLLDDFTTADLGETCYDKIYSIGAMEHVRPDEILSLLRKVHRAVKPGGRLVQHFFSLNGNDAMPTSMVGSQLFFPGSLLSLHSRHLATAAEAGFRLSHSSEHDYRPTLRAWFDRLAAAKNEAANLVGVQVTNKYLACFAASWAFFNLNKATLHRLVLYKD